MQKIYYPALLSLPQVGVDPIPNRQNQPCPDAWLYFNVTIIDGEKKRAAERAPGG